MPDGRQLSGDEELFWRALGRLAHVLPRLLDEDMTRSTGLSMTEYAVLVNLAEAPERLLRMTELAAATALSPSRITRVVDDLRARGLVAKQRHPGDARGAVAVLTADGLARQREAASHHLDSARRRVLDHVPVDAVGPLGQALQQVADRIAGTAGPGSTVGLLDP